MNMDEDIFADTSYGKAALAKMLPTDLDFRLYCAGHTDDPGTMFVKGCIFRRALRGPRKGELCIAVPGTDKIAYVTAAECQAQEEEKKP